MLLRTAIFKPANALVGSLLQAAAQRIDAAYQPKPGEAHKGAAALTVQGIFGSFELQRAYYYDARQDQGHYPADAALGLEVSYTPALAKLICLEGADEQTHQKAERHLEQTGGITVSARQIQRVVQRVGVQAQVWAGAAGPARQLRGGRGAPPVRQRGWHGRADDAGGTGGAQRQAT